MSLTDQFKDIVKKGFEITCPSCKKRTVVSHEKDKCKHCGQKFNTDDLKV